MNVPADPAFFANKFKRFITTGKFPNLFNRVKKMTSIAISNNPDFSCSTICNNCESWLEHLFLGIPSNCHRVYTEGLRGRISDDFMQLGQKNSFKYRSRTVSHAARHSFPNKLRSKRKKTRKRLGIVKTHCRCDTGANT